MSEDNKNIDYMNMSDEEIMGMTEPEWSSIEEDSSSEDLNEHEDVETHLEDNDTEEDTDVEEELDTEYEEEGDDEEIIEEEEDYQEDDVYEDDSDSEDEEDSESDEESEEDNSDTEEEDSNEYKTKYEALMAPLRAGKREINIETPEELRRLAQMGVGYNDSMAAIKPIRKIGKMLEKEGLLDESKVNFLIDLSKNDPNAIAKLINDSGIDPLDLDTEGTKTYEPNAYNVDDKELNLSDTLDVLKQTDSGMRVINEVNTKWDDSSKEVLLNNPERLNKLEEHINSGLYDQIMTILDKERTLGNVPQGVNDFDAYTTIGNHILASKNSKAVESEAQPKKQVSAKPKVVKKKSDTNRNKLRQAAATTRSKNTKVKQQTHDYLNMSDEEFEKLLK